MRVKNKGVALFVNENGTVCYKIILILKLPDVYDKNLYLVQLLEQLMVHLFDRLAICKHQRATKKNSHQQSLTELH